MNTVTRAQLAETIYAQVGLSRNDSADLLETVLERMSRALETGNSVKISGFGTFSVRQKGRRIGRNPKTGVEVPIEYQVVPVVIRVFEMDDNVSVWCEEKCGYREIVKSRLATTLARVLHGAGDPVHHLAPS